MNSQRDINSSQYETQTHHSESIKTKHITNNANINYNNGRQIIITET